MQMSALEGSSHDFLAIRVGRNPLAAREAVDGWGSRWHHYFMLTNCSGTGRSAPLSNPITA